MSGSDIIDFEQRLAAFGYDERSYAAFPAVKRAIERHAPTALVALYRYIAEDSGLAIAGSYIDRIEAACLALVTFPKRGIRQDDIRLGLRTMGFERRATIVFQVTATEVTIVRIFYNGQDYESALRRKTRV